MKSEKRRLKARIDDFVQIRNELRIWKDIAVELKKRGISKTLISACTAKKYFFELVSDDKLHIKKDRPVVSKKAVVKEVKQQIVKEQPVVSAVDYNSEYVNILDLTI